MTSPEQDVPTHARRPIVLRVAAGVLGTVVLLGSAVFTLGTSLAAPIGVLVLRRRARRHGRRLSGWVSWIGAATASSLAIGLLFGYFLLRASPESRNALGAALSADSAPPPPRTPQWLTRIFPQAAQPPNPATQTVIHSRIFRGYILVAGGVLMIAFLGSIVGSAGWAGTLLLGYAVASNPAGSDAIESGGP